MSLNHFGKLSLCSRCLRLITQRQNNFRDFKSSIHGISRSRFQVARKNRLIWNPNRHAIDPLKGSSVSLSEDAKERPIAQTTIDEEEREKFKKLSQTWWNELGEFKALHAMNALRIPWIRDTLTQKSEEKSSSVALPLDGTLILDAGSGGGLLTEPLARLGASIIGIDMVEDNIAVAQAHLNEDPKISPRIKYIQAAVEDLVETEEEKFDAVVSSEVVEHVSDLSTFVSTCCKLLKPGGSIFITTMNKTNISYALAVFAAEQVLKIVPEGTHDWNKFVSPEDLQYLLEKNGLTNKLIHGMLYNPLTNRWMWIQDASINYALHAVKSESSQPD